MGGSLLESSENMEKEERERFDVFSGAFSVPFLYGTIAKAPLLALEVCGLSSDPVEVSVVLNSRFAVKWNFVPMSADVRTSVMVIVPEVPAANSVAGEVQLLEGHWKERPEIVLPVLEMKTCRYSETASKVGYLSSEALSAHAL
jgi:hypothetical protein